MRKLGRWAWIGLTWVATAAAGDFTWTTNGDALALAKYEGAADRVAIPAEVEGRPVAAIGSGAFADRAGVKSVAIPDGVVRIEEKAFAYCSDMVRV